MSRRWRPVLAGVVTLLAVAGPMNARGDAQAAPTPLKVNREAFYTSRFTGSLPPVLVKQVPPAPICLVAPAQVCGPEVDALKVTLGLNKGLPVPDVPDYQLQQPVAPGTLPVGMIGGATRYTSALRFDLPAMPSNAQVDKFDLVLDEADLTFSIESPAFRGAILAALSQYPEQHPEAIQNYLAGLAAGDPAIANFAPTGIEACIIRGTWTAGPSQDGTKRPQADCLIGGTGKRDAAAGTWTFDISPIVQEWADGATNEGIYLGPLGAQNVAYGDPDASTNFQVSLTTSGAPGPTAVAEFSEKPPELTDSGAGVLGDSLGEDLSVAGPVDAVDPFAAALPSGSLPAVAGSTTPAAATRQSTRPEASTPWWIWLAFPLFAAGCYALAQALDASPETVTRRPGAMTRLVQTRAG